jgi:hypothetical protein
MSFLSSWLGSGKSRFVGTPVDTGFRPTLERLETREVPDATLVARQPDFTSQTDFLDLPADAPIQVLGTSSNGRYLLLQSKATNLARFVDATGVIRPQVSAPGQNNLFFLDRRDDGTNNIKLISAYDPAATFDTQFVPGQKGLGAAESVPGVSLNAVISDDGQSVAFLSGANAALFDSNLYLTSGFGVDSGGQDCFVWSNATGRVQLVSKTAKGAAIGGSGGVTNPSISPDGKVVTFVSDFNAQSIANRPSGVGATDPRQVLFNDDNNSPDIFRLDVSDPAGVVEPVSVLSVTQPFFTITVGSAAGGVLQNNVITALPDFQFQMFGPIGGSALLGMSVDPLGRYVTAGGAGFVGLHKSVVSGNMDAFRFNYIINAGTPAKNNSAPYNVSSAGQVATPLLPSVRVPGVVGNPFQNNGVAPTLATAVDAGSAEIGNAIVSLYNADVIFTYRQTAPIANPNQVALPNYVASPTATGADQFDLVQKGFIGSTLQFRVVSHKAGSPLQGVGFLDLRPGGYSITPDATKILFTSSAPAGDIVTDSVQRSAGAIVDTNNQFDIFQFDGTSVNSTSLVSVRNTAPNATGLGASTLPTMTPDGLAIAFQSTVTADDLTNIPDPNGAQTDIFVRDTVKRQTILASGVPGNISTGNAQSNTAVIVRSAQADQKFFRSFEVFFTSGATDLVTTVPIDPANPQEFSAKFPVFISSLPRSVSYTGGDGGFVTIARTDSVGNLIGTSRVQPFKGFTGEIRVATADFNGDGIPDVAVGAGPGGGPRVTIIDGFTLRALDNFFAFESSFTGGVYVGAGDINNDGIPELIVGAGEGGGPRVQAYNFTTGVRIFDQFAYEPSSRTGVHVAVGDFNGDGTNDIFIGAGAGGGPRVRVLSGKSLPNQQVLADFFAFDSSERNGVNISAGDYDADGKADIVVGTGNGSQPRVIVYNAAYAGLSDPNFSPFTAPPADPLQASQPVKFLDFVPFAPSDAVGARAVLRNIDGGQFAGLVVSSGGQLPVIQTYSGGRRGVDVLGNGLAPQMLQDFIPNNALFGSFGAYVG